MAARSVFEVVRPVLPSLLVLGLAACGSAGGATATPDPVAEPAAPPATVGLPTPLRPRPGGGLAGSGPVEHGGGAPYPILLMHGMAGFDQLQGGPVDITYFNGVVDDLAAHGEPLVFVTAAPPYDTSEDRAQAVAAQIQTILAQTGKAKVNLVGHSQGGMDARVLASPAGSAMGDVIASVTTVATPHQGSLVADAALGLLQGVPPGLIDQVTSAFLGLLQKTAYDVQTDPHLRAQMTELSQQYMTTTFNPKYVDDPRVVYASYGGPDELRERPARLRLGRLPGRPAPGSMPRSRGSSTTAQFLQGTTGVTNDGLVTIASARWGTFQQCVPADHLAEVGQIGQNAPDPVSGFDHLAFFRDLVARLRAQGL